jgi:hypothetical protein
MKTLKNQKTKISPKLINSISDLTDVKIGKGGGGT